MSKIIHFVHQSVDGFIEGPNGEFDWPMMGSELGTYSRGLSDEVDAFLYGRVVWSFMASYWPKAEEISTDEHDLKFAPRWREKRKFVVSRTLERADWNTTVVPGPEELGKLKEQPGNDMVLFGGSDLAASLTEHGLIDEYQVFVHPVVLGGGRPTFLTPAARFDLRLAESRTFDDKVVLLRYER
ncbi:dihydrofolate reductase [Prauserella shujinwangii]|uniref:Dihydrofolate reductase n=1 Tax=Prauserella shujinwangii TaxID=1453103 RepID=A0A2T0M1G6_9PSEU|nr:dihydrofolate reductase family protein [Prauserella shujinwangii]PRX50444.1 dihydrofolate reductase [Prauserella shujinwangii]